MSDPVLTIDGLGALRGAVVNVTEAPPAVAFRGIPYAKPPLGNLRWRPPQPFGGWPGVRAAAAFGAPCLGENSSLASEDCLTLNVLTPSAALSPGAPKLPVIVFIHGGSYTTGSSMDYSLELASLYIQGKAVWVTVNYRLGIFGFLGSRALANRSPDGSFGNYGIEDQRLALRWVQQYISFFGGDPGLVTIMGESAGGGSVINHLVQKSSWGLYSHAIIQSAWPNAVPQPWAERQFHDLMQASKCASVSCLVETDAQTLMDNVGSFQSSPVVDGVAQLLPADELIRRGHFNRVPVMETSVRDEAANDYNEIVQVYPYSALVPSAANMEAIIMQVLNKSLLVQTEEHYMPAFFSGFPAEQLPSLAVTLQGLLAPERFPYVPKLDVWQQMAMQLQMEVPLWGLQGLCYTRRRARWMQAAGQPTFFAGMYEYDSGLWDGWIKHGDDMLMFIYPPPDDKTVLANQQYMSYFVQFAASGDPNHAGAPRWPLFDAEASMLVHAYADAGGVRQASNLKKAVCDFWDEIYRNGTYGTSIRPAWNR